MPPNIYWCQLIFPHNSYFNLNSRFWFCFLGFAFLVFFLLILLYCFSFKWLVNGAFFQVVFFTQKNYPGIIGLFKTQTVLNLKYSGICGLKRVNVIPSNEPIGRKFQKLNKKNCLIWFLPLNTDDRWIQRLWTDDKMLQVSFEISIS